MIRYASVKICVCSCLWFFLHQNATSFLIHPVFNLLIVILNKYINLLFRFIEESQMFVFIYNLLWKQILNKSIYDFIIVTSSSSFIHRFLFWSVDEVMNINVIFNTFNLWKKFKVFLLHILMIKFLFFEAFKFFIVILLSFKTSL